MQVKAVLSIIISHLISTKSLTTFYLTNNIHFILVTVDIFLKLIAPCLNSCMYTETGPFFVEW